MLRILTKRIEAKAIDFIGKTQFGFRKGCGTREAIGVMRMLCERSLEMDNDVFVCFVDFEKAFDRVNWVKMMEVLKKIGVDWKDRRMISTLYVEQAGAVAEWLTHLTCNPKVSGSSPAAGMKVTGAAPLSKVY